MGIELDGTYGADNSGTDTLIFSVTVTKTNSVLILGLGSPGGPHVFPPYPTITFNGDSLSNVDYRDENSTGAESAIWYLRNPDVGTFNIECGFNTPGPKTGVVWVLNNAALVLPISSTVADTASPFPQSIDVAHDGSWLIGMWCLANDSALTASTGTTERYEGGSGSTTYRCSGADSNGPVAAGAQSLEMTGTSGPMMAGTLIAVAPALSGGSSGGGVAYSGGASFSF